MGQAAPRKPLKLSHFMRRVILYASLALVFFLLGFIPTWLKGREASASLARAENQVSLAVIQNNLGAAAISAQRGEYEAALQSASSFFTGFRAETNKHGTSALTSEQIAGLARIQPLSFRALLPVAPAT